MEDDFQWVHIEVESNRVRDYGSHPGDLQIPQILIQHLRISTPIQVNPDPETSVTHGCRMHRAQGSPRRLAKKDGCLRGAARWIHRSAAASTPRRLRVPCGTILLRVEIV